MNKTGSKILHGMLLATSAMVGSGMIVSTAAMANPAGGSVAVGSATITNPSATQTVIKQSSQRALINWNSFNVGSGSSVIFNQPNTKSLTVNRVTGPGSSTINGSLTANGNIWLLNANGILFGKGSQINVGSLLATTSELSDADFKAGNNDFTASPNPNATVINQGTITASRGGSVLLSAPAVSNEGMIQADLGTVVLGGAQAFTVDMTGDNLLRYQISAPVSQTPTDSQGKPALALVNNSGTIAANGGHVVMTARAAQNVQDNVINNTGMVEATSVSVHNGEVDIDAGPDGTANVGGTVDVSGSGSGQTGGTVTVTGGTVNVADGAKINASGSAGGGTVLIGGGPHGTGTLAHAQRTIIGAATISADATVNGNGGNVTVWSDGTTQFNGSISARGGAAGGNGGQVETSGHNLGVSSSAKVDTSAPLGLTGDWLLDPTTIEIVNGADGTDDPISGTASTISNGTIIAALASSNVTLEATAANPSCASISVDSGAPITWSSGNTLSLLSEGNITIQSNIQSSGAGGINIIAGWDGSSGVTGSYNGANSVDVSAITTSGAYGNACGSVSIGSFASVGSASGVTTVAGYDVTLDASAGLAQIGYYGNGGGDIFVDAKNNVVLTADPASDPFDIAKIGNDGATGSSAQTGNITIVAGNDVTLTGGGASSYAQIGNGGNHNSTSTSGDVSGDISINATGNVSLTGGSGGFALIGNGAEDSNEINSGDINITAHDVTLLGGNSEFAQIGNGGFDSQGGSGNITVNATGNVSLTADPSSLFGYALIGNGGTTSGGGSGNVSVTAGGDLTLTAGEEYAQIGNGGYFVSGDNSGNVTVNVTGTITLTGTGSDDNTDANGYAEIGLGGRDLSGTNNGTVNVTAGSLSLVTANNATYFIGNQGGDTNDGDISVVVSGTATLDASNGTIAIGNTGGSENSGNVNLSFGNLSDSSGALTDNVVTDLAGGDVSITYTNQTSSGVGELDYDSSHNLTIASTGDLALDNAIDNTGSGRVSLAAGYDPAQGNIENAGTLTIDADITTASTDTTYASAFEAGDGIVIGGNIDVGGGRIYMRAGEATSDGNAGAITDPDGYTLTADTLSILNDKGGADTTVGTSDAPIEISANHLGIEVADDDVYIDSPNGGFDVGDGFNGISDIGGNVTLSANGSITQDTSDSLGIQAATLSVTTTGTDHAIALTDGGGVGDDGNDISGAVSLNSAADLTFVNTETTLLTGASAGGVISIDVTNTNQYAETNGDARLIVNGAITADGTGQSTLHAVGDIVNDPLVNPNAAFDEETNPASINTAITADELNLISDNGSVGGVDLAGDTTFFLGTAVNALHVSTGSAGGINVSNGKSFTIGIAGDGTGLNVGTGGGYIGAAVGDMTQLSGADGAIVSTGGIAFGATGNFTLNNADNQVSGDLTLYAHSGSNVSFTNNGTTTLGGIAEDLFDTTTVGGNVTLTVTNGSVSQSGALYADNLTINAAGGNNGSLAVNLTNSDNDLTGTLTVTTPGDVNFTNSRATTLGNISNGTSSAGNVTITASDGTLSQGEGTSILAATLTVNAANGSVVLTNTSNNVTGAFSGNVSGDISFENNSTITLGDVDGGFVFVQACGPIPAHYDPIAAGNITITALHGGIDVTGGVLGTNISLVAPGNITQEHDSGLDGGNFNVTSSSANISLLSDNDFTGTVNISAVNGTAAFGNNDNTLLGTVNVKGDLTVLSEGNLTVSSSIQNAGSANITLVGGWDGSTTDTASLGNDGVYGNYDSDGTYGDVFIGDGSSSGLVSVGSKSGLTTIEGHAINVNAANGSQIGYNGSGATGNINILGTGVLTLGGSSPDASQIGNGSTFGQKSNAGDIIIDAGSISVSGNASYLAGNNASIETTAGDIGSSENPLVVALNTIAIPFVEKDDEGDGADVYISSPGGGISIGNNVRNIGANGIQTNGGDLVLTATGDITQTSSVLTGSAELSTSSGNITLTSGGNYIDSVALTAPGNATLYDLTDLTVTGGGATGNLTLLTTGDLTFTGSVQKTSGDILAVAGWDGTTTPSGIAANATSYGNNKGSITIGGEDADGDVSVGSATGTTSVYGYDVDIDAENGLAQLGYNGNGTGTINVTARHDVSVTSTGGDCYYECYSTGGYTAQIGNGSFDATGAVGGNITVNAGHDIFLDAENGGGESGPNVAVIGNEGVGTSVNGTINITAAGNISLYDANDAYTQIGNDGGAEDVVVSGDINVTANGTQGISLTDDLDGWSSQIGNYAYGDGASVGGNVTVTANYGGIVLDAGGEDGTQIGNFGAAEEDGEVTIGGNVFVNSLGGDLQLEAGVDDSVAQIGNSGDANGGTMGGNVTVNVTGNLNLTATYGGYVQIGNGSPLGLGNDGPISGNINVNATGNITLSASSETDSTYALIGNGDLTGESSGNVSGDINLHSGGALTFDDVGGNDQVWLGNVAGDDDGDIESGNITVVANSENDLDDASFGEMIQDDLGSSSNTGGNVFVGMTSDAGGIGGISYNSPHTFTIASTNNLTIAGTVLNAGAGALNLIGGWNGNTTLPTSPLTTASGYFGNNNGKVTIGGSTLAAVGSKSGVTTVAGSNVTVSGAQAGAQIGYTGAASGNISVLSKHDVSLTAGGCANCDAQIGDGGSNATLSGGGNISVQALGNVTLSGGSQSFAYAQIGNGGDSSTGSFGGNINVTAGGAVSLTGSFDYAQIGNGGDGAHGNAGGNITVSANGNVSLIGASSNKNGYVQIGNGGESANGNESGNISVTSNHTIALTAGNNGRYAQIGNGVAVSGAGGASGNITVKAAALTLTGATAASTLDDYAQIGNDTSLSGSGPVSGNINVTVSGTATINSTVGGGFVGIGNQAIYPAGSGNVTITVHDLNAAGDANNALSRFIQSDLQWGNVTLGITDSNASNDFNFGNILCCSNSLSILSAGNLTFDSGIQDSGNVTLVAGWNPSVAASAVATTLGAYGNNNGTITIGGANATGDSWVGSSNGTTTVLTDNLTLDGVNGGAQLGLADTATNPNASGNINVSALGNVLLEAQSGHIAQIGNGSTIVNGAVSGNVVVNAGGNVTLNTVAGSIAAIGNMGGANASESGNVTVVSKGALTVNATGNNTIAHIGDWTDGATAGTSTGNIVVNAISVSLISGGNTSYALIGDGDFHTGTDTGTVSGNISVNTGALSLTSSSGGSGPTQSRIGNLGSGASNGSIAINATGNILLSGTNQGLASIGNTGGNASPSAGNLSVQSGGTISLLVANGGDARIANFGSQTGAVTVNAAGDILLQTSGTNPGGESLAFIGALPNGASQENVSVTSANGNISLQANAANSTAMIGDDTGSSTVPSSGNVTVSAVHGAVTVAAGGTNAAAVIGMLGGNISGATTITGQSLTGLGASAMNDLASGNVSLTSLGSGDLVLSGGSANSGNNLVVASAGNIDVTGTMQNAGNGNITLSSKGAVTVGGSGAASVGSKGGTTNVSGASVQLSAINGYAQIGYHGGGSGAILVNATGDITLNGGSNTAYFAQIGDGGYKVSGSNSGAVSVSANGNVTLNAGSGQEAYAQIGNGGAESNSNSSGYTDTGAVTISGNAITLGAGSGGAAYAQIGDGGYKSGQSVNGASTVGGDITINAVSGVTLNGNAADAYAQIGNGGDFINNGAANGSSGTIGGNISVAVSNPTVAGNAIVATAGSGANSYVQIGNGGNGENTPGSGNTVTYNISGNITVDDLALTGSNTGANGYAQIGNGDGAGTGTGNISGDITISQGTQFFLTPGTAPGTSTDIQNNTGTGTVSGSVSGYSGGTTPPPPPAPASDPTTAGSVSTIIQNSNTPTTYVFTQVALIPEFSNPANDFGGSSSSEQTPLEKLAGEDEDDTASDGIAHSVSDLSKNHVTTAVLIPGVLEEIVTLTPRNPHGIPPADEDYSSWGNEAFWRW